MNYTRILTFALIFVGIYTQASEQPLVQNILEDITLSNDEKGWNDISELSKKKIGSLIMKDHPIVQFIMKRVSIPSKTLKGHEEAINSAASNSSEDKILTASDDKTVKIWDVRTRQCITTLEGHTSRVSSAVFTSSGDKVLTSSGDTTAKIWDAQNGNCLVTLTGHARSVNSAVFHGSEDRVLTASWDNTAKIWDARTGKCITTLTGHEHRVRSAVFTSSGDKVLTASWDRTAKIWDARTGKCITTFKGHPNWVNSAVFNRSEDKVLTASSDTTAKIWNTHTGECITTLEGHTRNVSSAVFNKNADKVLTASWDGTAKIWDVITGLCTTTLEGHHAWQFMSARFNGSEDKVFTACDDGTARIWDISVLVKLEEFFSQEESIKKRVTLKQALILDAIYEIIICRKWAQKYPEKFYVVGEEGQRIKNIPISEITENLRFDFNKYPHLQKGEKGYEGLPQEVQAILDPYVKKTDQDNEASTFSTINIETG